MDQTPHPRVLQTVRRATDDEHRQRQRERGESGGHRNGSSTRDRGQGDGRGQGVAGDAPGRERGTHHHPQDPGREEAPVADISGAKDVLGEEHLGDVVDRREDHGEGQDQEGQKEYGVASDEGDALPGPGCRSRGCRRGSPPEVKGGGAQPDRQERGSVDEQGEPRSQLGGQRAGQQGTAGTSHVASELQARVGLGDPVLAGGMGDQSEQGRARQRSEGAQEE
jgi:hypothetical protein